jgi:hypothetical protein
VCVLLFVLFSMMIQISKNLGRRRHVFPGFDRSLFFRRVAFDLPVSVSNSLCFSSVLIFTFGSYAIFTQNF